MLALCIGLVALSAMTTGFCMTMGVWLHSANSTVANARDLLDAEQTKSSQYQHERDVSVAAHDVTKRELSAEKNLRAIADAHLIEVQRNLRESIAKHMESATNEEIDDLVRSVFSSLDGVPSLPVLHRASTDDADLEKP